MFARQPLFRIFDVAGAGHFRPKNGTMWSRRALPLLRESNGRAFSTTSRCSARRVPTRPQQQQQQPPPKKDTESLATLWEQRKFGLIASGIAAAVIGGYIMMLAISINNAPQCKEGDDQAPSGRPLDLRKGKISASAFDRDLNRPENLMGVTGLRELMGNLARGHVLEVAVGTGRNIEFIDWDEIRATAPPVATDTENTVREIKSEEQLTRERRLRRIEKGQRGMILPGDEAPEVLSYTGVDVSTDVLEVAWTKLRKNLPELVPRRKKRSQEAHETQQPVGPQQESQQGEAGKSRIGNTAATMLQAISSNKTTSAPSTPSLPVQEEDMILVANIGQGRIRLYKSDAQTRLPPPPAMSSHDGTKIIPAPAYYDTILQNFGLCSVSDPQKMLAHMATLLRPGSGRIYLLEHGRGWYSWLNGLLDKFAPAHFQRYGCWWNRDIEAIIRKAEAEIPGLEVVRIDRPLALQAGTMIWIELKVNPDCVQK